MCKAVLGYDGTLKADTLRFPQTLLQIRYAAYLAAEADFTDGNELIAHGAVQKRRYHAQADGKVAGGIPQSDAADDVDIHVQIAEEIACTLFQHGDEQVHAVVVVAAAGPPGCREIRLGRKGLYLAENGAVCPPWYRRRSSRKRPADGLPEASGTDFRFPQGPALSYQTYQSSLVEP